MLNGSCLCGNVRFQVSGPPLVMYYCHCGMCRKATGSSFATNMLVPAEDFAIVAGQDSVKAYRSSPGESRHFCSSCGSPVYNETEHRRGVLSIRCGLLDNDPMIRPAYHIFTAFKAPWSDIADKLPQHPESPP